MLVSSEIPRQTSTRERWAKLKMIREPRRQHWLDIQSYLIPYAGIFLYDPRERERDYQADRWQDIIDEWGANAVETLESGMMALRTNPSKPWFKYQTQDPDLNRHLPVKEWFNDFERMTRLMHRISNTNQMLPNAYGECASFGTAGSIMAEDPKTIIHHHVLTAGEFAIACDFRGDVDTLYREFRMTVAQMYEQFGASRCSVTVRALAGNKQWDAKVPVIHAIEPRDMEDREPGALDAKNMPWKSVYFELDAGDVTERYLSESGYSRFPCLTPRWRTKGGDIWGEGPGTKALGSVRQLQVEQERKAKVIDYQTDPPLQGPTGMREQDRDLLPGGYFPYDQNTPHGGVRTAFEVKLDIAALLADIQDVRARIDKSFFVHLFQPITMLSDTTQRTAQEIIQRRAEILTVLGPVTLNMQRELDRPLIQFGFERLIAERKMRPPPPELAGQMIDVEFIGPLAQALKETDAANVDRLVAHVAQVAELKSDVIDRYNADGDVEVYADMLGVDPHLIVAGEKVALIREKRAEMQAAAANAQALESGARAGKDLSAAMAGAGGGG